ncbi:uncharacterized protein BO80DRAFT_441142 [Aspergillus ibericus CBS 121593]|uniref:Uncharacterized protein n=1 Tax=Aspergillus ibericus CBS 121593 TaxID=1448316 RepID=A0A395HCM5_9EURO|nr:hypothetical protein BO80DRAFT_441142 [Aspergillus ibericus CBS 121593]RAL04905.1 hypothetical protein BO80DRAFT_441142 [Aspergillus ibericus CBS 121593]
MAYKRPSDAQYTWVSTPNLCGMQSNGLDSLASHPVSPDTEYACSSDSSEYDLREVSHLSSDGIDHHHLSSVLSVKHAIPLPTEGSVPTIEQSIFPQGNIGNNEDPTSVHGFNEELEPRQNSVNGSRSPPASLQPLSRTHSRDLTSTRDSQQSTNSNTIDLSLSTDRALDTQYCLRPDKAQQKRDDSMQLDYPFERDLEHVKFIQNSLVDGSAPTESESENGRIWSENRNSMLANSPPSPGFPCAGLSLVNDAEGGLLDETPEEYQFIDLRSTACQDTMIDMIVPNLLVMRIQDETYITMMRLPPMKSLKILQYTNFPKGPEQSSTQT